jgi:hypothetical protein
MRTRKLRHAFAIAIIAGPLCTACELVFEFDRSLLPPEYDAAAPDAGKDSSSSSTTGKPDGSSSTDSSTPPPEDASDSSTTTDADAS